MKPSLLFRIASVLIVLFAAGHTIGFRQVDPQWSAGAVVDAMKTVHFSIQGFDQRSYWGFYVGFGLFVTVAHLLAAALCWQLGGSLSRREPGFTRSMGAVLTACFAAYGLLSWLYFFATPVVFSALIIACLLAATLLTKPASDS